MIRVRASQPTLAAMDAVEADLRRIRPAMVGHTPEDRYVSAEAAANRMAEKLKALRLAMRADLQAARAADRANEARNRAMPIVGRASC